MFAQTRLSVNVVRTLPLLLSLKICAQLGRYTVKLLRDAKILVLRPNFEHTRQVIEEEEEEVGGSHDNIGEKKYVYTVLARKHKERQIGRPKRRCDDSVKMNPEDISLYI